MDETLDSQDPPRLKLPSKDDYHPLMLLALNSTSAVDWEELLTKVRDGFVFTGFANSYPPTLQAKTLAIHLAKPLGRFREHLAVPRPPFPTSAATSPPPRS